MHHLFIIGSITDSMGGNLFIGFYSAFISGKGAKSFTQRSPGVFMFCYKRFFSSLPLLCLQNK
jgi:hypothetical protein